MLHARIVSPRGSLYFAAEATPYDLENLRTHVHDLQSPKGAHVRLELSLDHDTRAAMDRRMSALLRQLAAEGVQVSVCPDGAAEAETVPRRVPARSRR